MKKNLSLLLLASLGLSMSAQNIQQFSAKPSGNANFVVSYRMQLDSMKVRPNQTLVFTPVVEDDNNTATLRSLIVNGRKQHYVYERNNGNKNYPDAIELQRRNGEEQAYDYREAIALEPWMRDARVRISIDTCGCGNLMGRNAGTPVDVNPHWDKKCGIIYATPASLADDDPVFSLQGKAYLDFPVNRTELHPDYHNNAAELHKIMATIDTVRNNSKVTITSISIHGYASPEGSYSNNTRLAQGRAATLTDYVKRQYDLPAEVYHVESTPEDWAGLESFLEQSNLPEKEELLKIVRSDMEPDPKDAYLRKNFPEAYNTILNACYPYLRHSDYRVEYKIAPMTDQEAAELLKTEPRLLSLTKMYRIAKLYPEGSDDYNNVLLTAANIYPNDEAANANAANVAIKQGNVILAKEYLKRAGNNATSLNVQGIIAMMEDRYDDARQLFKEAGNEDNLKLVP